MKIIHGDCLKEMKKMQSESIDCIVTDPPYGLSFMGKKWDKEVPSVDYWSEALRISKPGSFLLSAGAPRSHHHLAMAIENAGWEITDCIMHLFGSGFPKGKSQLKPAYEPWILARKRSDKVQALNIDDCRIGTDDTRAKCSMTALGQNSGWNSHKNRQVTGGCENGRWPANLIIGDEEVEEMLDEQSGVSLPKMERIGKKGGRGFGFFDDEKTYNMTGRWPSDKGVGASRFFYCAKASKSERNKGCEGMPLSSATDKGSEKRITVGGSKEVSLPRANHHPTVKPQKLMEYLIKLVMPKHEGAVLLDPFLGSGSTLVACQTLGINAIGIEMNEEYCEIAKKRLQIKPIEQLNLF